MHNLLVKFDPSYNVSIMLKPNVISRLDSSGNKEGEEPYEAGEPCSSCPEEMPECVENACGKTRTNSRFFYITLNLLPIILLTLLTLKHILKIVQYIRKVFAILVSALL